MNSKFSYCSLLVEFCNPPFYLIYRSTILCPNYRVDGPDVPSPALRPQATPGHSRRLSAPFEPQEFQQLDARQCAEALLKRHLDEHMAVDGNYLVPGFSEILERRYLLSPELGRILA